MRGWGWGSIFCPCLFFNINQRSELRWCNWVFAEIVEGITSKSQDGFHFHFVTFQHAEGGICVYIQGNPLHSSLPLCFLPDGTTVS